MKKYLLVLLAFLLISFVSAESFGYGAPSTSADVTILFGNLTSLSQLVDVNIPAPTDNQFLTYDNSISKWIAKTVAGLTLWDAIFNASFASLDSDTTYSDLSEFNDDIFAGFNHTLTTYSLWNTAWLSTYNATYDASVGNLSWNQSVANTLYAPNTTAGIQWLVNGTGIYSTYNATYNTFILNVSRNWTAMTYTGYNDGWATTYNATYEAINTTENIQGLLNGTSMNFTNIIGVGAISDSIGDLTIDMNMKLLYDTLGNWILDWDAGGIGVNGNISLSKNLMVTGNATANWFNGFFNWIIGIIGVGSSNKYQIFNGSTLSFNETVLNNSIDARIAVTYYNATSIDVIDGTLDAGNLASIQTYDEESYNVSESVGAPALDIRVNFTGVTDFNELIVRMKTTDAGNHRYVIQIYDYVLGGWEDYTNFVEIDVYKIISLGVYDSADHLNGGVVAVRFYLGESGIPAHGVFLDWVVLSDGPATFSTSEIDPLSFHRGESINNTGFNISADYFLGDGSKLNGISTFNSTYNTFILNVSRNWTAMTYAGYNDDWLSTYNSTYDNYAIANFSNISNYWDGLGSVNATQMEDSGGVLNILVSWLIGLFYTETEIDSLLADINTTSNIQGLLNFTGIYSTYNATYNTFILNVSLNYSEIVFDTWDTRWSAGTLWDTTFNNSFLDLDKQYSFNATYNTFILNVSRNWTAMTYTGYDSRWLQTLWDSTFNDSFDARDSDTTYADLSDFNDDILWTSTFNDSFDDRDSDTQLSEDNVEAFIFDTDNTANLGMGGYNITAMDCIIFESGGKICSGT